MRELRHTWIPLSDGARLAARIWLPDNADTAPVPALFEYIPYRKSDATAERDATIHPYFADHGYASVRVDLRGSGDSDGIMLGEYLAQELDDGVEVVAWLAAQDWCSGEVGMFGKSWGGFNSLQIAALRPPALKAIISIDSTDDRYADDVHYMGGCVLASDMLAWGATMLVYTARPPDPEVVGERWRDQWLERLEQSTPFAEEWLRHQRRDEFWRHGSVCEDFSQIDCAVYMVGGWADAYTNAVLRILAGCDCPRKGLIGPWAHTYPHQGIPEPAIGFLDEALRWWDYWLKGVETGIMDEPMLRAWMQQRIEPATTHPVRPGRWVAESTWPSERSETRSVVLGTGTHTIQGLQHAGLDAGTWWPLGRQGEHPGDQREQDGASLCFDSPPLDRPLEVLGFPEAVLTLFSDRPLALVACRLCDVAPEGSSFLVTRGLLNLTHRESHAAPAPLDPGTRYEVRVRLNAIGHAFPAGHRIRLTLSPTYFPFAWPSPEPVELTIVADLSRLDLPVRLPAEEDADLRRFGEPEVSLPLLAEHDDVGDRRMVTHDLVSGRHELVVERENGVRLLADGLSHVERSVDRYAIDEGAPLSAETTSDREILLERGDWGIRVNVKSRLTADAETFEVVHTLAAVEGDREVFSREWRAQIARDLA